MVLAPAAVSAVSYGGFGGRPAYPREDNPRTESIFIHTLEPGAVQEEGVRIINNANTTKTIMVYAVDGAVATEGAFTCEQKSQEKDGVGSWIAIEKEELVVQPGTEQIVPFTITAPASASAGEQNGCIMIQEKKDPVKQEGGGVSLSFRTGLRVALTIPGELIRQLEVVDLRLEKQEGGHYLLHPIIKNTGNVSIDTDVKVVVKALLGNTFTEKGGTYPILRGETSEWNFEIHRPFWGGWHRAQLLVEYDKSAGAGIGVESGAERTVIRGPTRWFFSVPSWQAMLVYAAVLLAIAYGIRFFLRERQVRRWIEKSWKPYEVSAGDTVTGLADRCGIPWKMLAKANKLKPPYALVPGSEIRAPRMRRPGHSSE